LTDSTKTFGRIEPSFPDRMFPGESARAGDATPQESAAGDSVTFWPLCPRAGLVSDYDFRNVMIYIRLLNAESNGADACEMARTIFLGAKVSNLRFAKMAAQAHLRRAHWLLEKKFFPLMWALGD
jgi:hypothetical protein